MLSGPRDRQTRPYFPRKFLANKLAIASSLSTLRKTYKTRRWRRSTGRYTGERETRHHGDPIQKGEGVGRGQAEQEVSLLAFEVGGLRITWQPISNYSSFLRGISRVSPVYRTFTALASVSNTVVDVNIWNIYKIPLSLNIEIKFFKIFRYFCSLQQYFRSFYISQNALYLEEFYGRSRHFFRKRMFMRVYISIITSYI